MLHIANLYATPLEIINIRGPDEFVMPMNLINPGEFTMLESLQKQ